MPGPAEGGIYKVSNFWYHRSLMELLKTVEFRNIVVRMPNWIGDMVMATPVLTDLRRAYPESRITAMCRSPTCELLREDPDIDELFCFSKTSGFARHNEKKNVIAKLRQGKYDLGILLTGSFSSAWWFWQGNVKFRLGYACDWRRLLLSHPVRLGGDVEQQHRVVTYKNLLKPLGLPISDTSPRLFLTGKEVDTAKTLLKQHGIAKATALVGINPGATYGSAKCWLPERFREVAQKLLADPGVRVVFFGDQQSAALVKQICRDLGPNAVNLAGLTSLREVAALISLCAVLLTNDSGPMHIADALGTEVVALFGSTSEIVTGPYRKGRVLSKNVSCSPCYQRSCPIDFRCMKEISADEVHRAICETLKSTKSKLHVIA